MGQKSKKRFLRFLKNPKNAVFQLWSSIARKKTLQFFLFFHMLFKIAYSYYPYHRKLRKRFLTVCYKASKFPVHSSANFGRRKNLLVSKNFFFHCLLEKMKKFWILKKTEKIDVNGYFKKSVKIEFSKFSEISQFSMFKLGVKRNKKYWKKSKLIFHRFIRL